MRPTSQVSLVLLLLALPTLMGCGDDDPTAPGGAPRSGTHFEMDLEGNEMAGMAYDRARDRLYVLEDVHSGSSRVHRYDFVTGTLREVLELQSQHDYAIRIAGDELWVARTYDGLVARFTGLDSDTLTATGTHGPGSPEMREISDLAMLGDDVYVVCGNFLVAEQHDGIRMLAGPGYGTLVTVLDEGTAAWPDSGYTYTRSIVPGDPGELIAATGSGGDLVRYGTDGSERARISGLGDSWLARDGQGRIYAVDPGEGQIRRYSPDLAMAETFRDDGPLWYVRFVVREVDGGVQVIRARFREDQPSFDWVLLSE